MTLAPRWLRVCALALALLQGGVLCAAPMAACCTAAARASGNAAADECCPAGSHPPGQCPMHASRTSVCRLACTSHERSAVPAAHAAVLPAPIAIHSTLIAGPCVAQAPRAVLAFDLVPDSPPPRT